MTLPLASLALALLLPVAASAQDLTAAPCVGAGPDAAARDAAMIANGWTPATDRPAAAALIAPALVLVTQLPRRPSSPADQERLLGRLLDPDSNTMQQLVNGAELWTRDDLAAAALPLGSGDQTESVTCVIAGPALPQVTDLPPAPANSLDLPAHVWFERLPSDSGAEPVIVTYIQFDLPFPTHSPVSLLTVETRLANFP